MFAKSLRKLLSLAVVAAAAFIAVNLASPSQAQAQHGHRGHHGQSHGGHHGQSHGGHYRGAHGGHGHYSHNSYYSGYDRSSFRVQIAPPIYRYGSSYGHGYNCAPSYGYGSYVRPGLSLHFGF